MISNCRDGVHCWVTAVCGARGVWYIDKSLVVAIRSGGVHWGKVMAGIDFERFLVFNYLGCLVLLI